MNASKLRRFPNNEDFRSWKLNPYSPRDSISNHESVHGNRCRGSCVQVIPCSTQLCTSHQLLYPTVYKSSLALPNCVQVIPCSTKLCTSHPLLYPTVYKSSLALPNCVQVIPCSTQLCTSHPLLYPTVYKSSLALPNCVQVIPCSTQHSFVNGRLYSGYQRFERSSRLAKDIVQNQKTKQHKWGDMNH